MSLDSVEKLFRKKREELPEDVWRKCVEHVKKIEENYWESDRIQDNKVEQLIIKLKPTDSSSSEMESFSKSSDSSGSDQPGGVLQLHLYGGVWPQDWKIGPSTD